jgi:hypothetical protein
LHRDVVLCNSFSTIMFTSLGPRHLAHCRECRTMPMCRLFLARPAASLIFADYGRLHSFSPTKHARPVLGPYKFLCLTFLTASEIAANDCHDFHQQTENFPAMVE